MMKVKKVYYFIVFQLFLNTLFLIWGFYFKSDNNTISSSILGIVTKVQCTNDFQNFIWLFSHNLTIMFLSFWLSYFTFGVIGTIWSINNAFMLGALTKIYRSILNNGWLSITFMAIEFVATLIITFSSTYFRSEKTYLKKFNNESIYSRDYMIKKKAYEKNILRIFMIVAILLLISAILETLVLHSI